MVKISCGAILRFPRLSSKSIEAMYSPVLDGIEKTVQSVQHSEAKPPSNLSGFVHSFWELKTETVLTEDFSLHALPDACVNILFNQMDTRIAGVTALHTTYTVLNLGKEFHYVGIQFYPGVWQGNRDEIANRFVGTPYLGSLPLVETSQALAALDFSAKQPVLSALVEWMIAEKLVLENVVTAKILSNIDAIHSVSDMAEISNMSPRQLQRTLKRTTGFSPHDFLKVLRLQHSFREHYLAHYADQSHFIHAFQKITGYTPAKYISKFDV
jgi:AraC-like DNA-binding protein